MASAKGVAVIRERLDAGKFRIFIQAVYVQALQPTLQNAGAGVTALQRCKMKREMKRNTGLFLLALGVKECLSVECRIF